MNYQEAQNCILAVKPTMKAPYKSQLLKLVLESENLQDSKVNLQKKMADLNPQNKNYSWASCPVWKAIQTQKCPTGENLVSFDKTTKIFKMNVDTLTSEQKSKLLGLVEGLLN
uniref:ORF46 n=1 Tax=Nitrosopumilaceae spindle-shaped virus TaxID=3065433 RepID=A0AAT9JEV6_9VIRU